MNKDDRLGRLIAALNMLDTRRGEAVKVAAERLEVSPRTVEMWLERKQGSPVPTIKLKYLEATLFDE